MKTFSGCCGGLTGLVFSALLAACSGSSGSLGLDQECSATQQCVPGLFCVEGTCRRLDDGSGGSGASLSISTVTGNSSAQPGRVASGLVIEGTGFGTQPTVALVTQARTFNLPVAGTANNTLVHVSVPAELKSALSAGALSGEIVVQTAAGGVARQAVSVLQGETGAPGTNGSQGPQGPQGPQGVQGPQGAAGSLRIYGIGSAGALNVTSNSNWSSINTPNANYDTQFTTCTVAAGVTLTVPSGTVIRCSGAATIDGNIVVGPGAAAYRATAPNANIIRTVPNSNYTFHFANAGLARVAAAMPGFAMSTATALGAPGGEPLAAAQARHILRPGPTPAGAGSGAVPGHGGGSFTLIAQGAITIGASGEIAANGGAGSIGGGGGAGGFIILASPSTITNNGLLEAGGGGGGASNSVHAPGGGGGGGIVHLIAPTVSEGSTFVEGGAGQTNGSQTDGSTRIGGGGGGALGGAGGRGGDTPSQVSNEGLDGYVLITRADPAALF